MNIFMTGLPYSGSNIIVTLLQQNPKFGVYYDTPLFHLTNSIIDETLSQGGYNTQCDEDLRFKIIENLFSTFYEHEHNVNIDYKWNYVLPIVNKLGGKIICCVRDINAILNEYEYEFFKNPTQQSYRGNVYSRCQDHMNGELGDRYNSVKQIINYNSTDIMMIEHDFLINNLEKTFQYIYRFLDLPMFEHNFAEYESSNPGYDLSKEQSPVILPPDIIQQYSSLELWRKNG